MFVYQTSFQVFPMTPRLCDTKKLSTHLCCLQSILHYFITPTKSVLFLIIFLFTLLHHTYKFFFVFHHTYFQGYRTVRDSSSLLSSFCPLPLPSLSLLFSSSLISLPRCHLGFQIDSEQKNVTLKTRTSNLTTPSSFLLECVFVCNRIKKDEGRGKEKSHSNYDEQMSQ